MRSPHRSIMFLFYATKTILFYATKRRLQMLLGLGYWASVFQLFPEEFHIGMLDGQLTSTSDNLIFMHHVTSGWESGIMSVCFDPNPLSPCSLYVTFPPAPPKATYIFFGDKGKVLDSRWLGGSGPVPGPCHTEPPQGPTSWRLRHQRGPGSGGWVEPGLTLPCPLHDNVWVRSHSLTLTFTVICVYQW